MAKNKVAPFLSGHGVHVFKMVRFFGPSCIFSIRYPLVSVCFVTEGTVVYGQWYRLHEVALKSPTVHVTTLCLRKKRAVELFTITSSTVNRF